MRKKVKRLTLIYCADIEILFIESKKSKKNPRTRRGNFGGKAMVVYERLSA